MGSGTALDRFLRGLPPPPPRKRSEEKRTVTATAAAESSSAAVTATAPSSPPPPPPPFRPARIFEVRLASSGPLPGWGGGAWCVLRVSSQGGGGGEGGGGSGGGLSLDSDECSPRRVVAAPWLRVSGDPRPLRTSRALAQGAGVAVNAPWSACGGGEEEEAGGGGKGTLTVGGISGGDEEEEEEEGQTAAPLPGAKKQRRSKLPPLQTLRLAGMSPEEAADLCLEIRSRVAAAREREAAAAEASATARK